LSESSLSAFETFETSSLKAVVSSLITGSGVGSCFLVAGSSVIFGSGYFSAYLSSLAGVESSFISGKGVSSCSGM